MTTANVYSSLLPQYNPTDTPHHAIFDYLQQHQEDWHTSDEIATALDIGTRDSNRVIRKSVAILRAEGYPIISSPLGFKFTTDREEITQCIHQLQVRVLGIQRAIDSLQKYAIQRGQE